MYEIKTTTLEGKIAFYSEYHHCSCDFEQLNKQEQNIKFHSITLLIVETLMLLNNKEGNIKEKRYGRHLLSVHIPWGKLRLCQNFYRNYKYLKYIIVNSFNHNNCIVKKVLKILMICCIFILIVEHHLQCFTTWHKMTEMFSETLHVAFSI